jgi:hypothetical protein
MVAASAAIRLKVALMDSQSAQSKDRFQGTVRSCRPFRRKRDFSRAQNTLRALRPKRRTLYGDDHISPDMREIEEQGQDEGAK